jgi:hypothetical protein
MQEALVYKPRQLGSISEEQCHAKNELVAGVYGVFGNMSSVLLQRLGLLCGSAKYFMYKQRLPLPKPEA